MIRKIKLSFTMLKWNIDGWIDNSSPMWFQILFWTIYHSIESYKLELKN